MQPLGMRGRVKLSDLFINAGVPQPARARWPLVCDSRSIVWVPGLRLADRVRLADDSRRAWMLKLVRNPVLE
jgi:tRNA(Ile)-lysidine synthase